MGRGPARSSPDLLGKESRSTVSWPILACSLSTSRSRSASHPGRRRRRRLALRSPAAASSRRKPGWGGPPSAGPERQPSPVSARLQRNLRLKGGVNLASCLRHGSLRLSNGAADLQLSPGPKNRVHFTFMLVQTSGSGGPAINYIFLNLTSFRNSR